MTDTVLCLCAHSDDHIFGTGGALAKYSREGLAVHTVIFSYGEASHPHLQPEVIRKIRIDEANAADKIIGGSSVTFLGLKEGKFREDSQTVDVLVSIIKRHDPVKIFTHASDDPHPDHKAVFDLVKEAYDRSKHQGSVYTFDVWTPFSTQKRGAPRLVVDVSKTFKYKLRAIRCFRSQLGFWGFIINNNYVVANIVVRNFFAGLAHGHTFAEVFYKLR
jgi:N-acetylglucosamine malate deacetylase 1